MKEKLGLGEMYVLGQLCWVSLHDHPAFELDACLSLERKKLVYRNLLGKWRLTESGRAAARSDGCDENRGAARGA